jgi:hypothetical protein
MLFRNISGDIIELNKYDYINDYIYYTKIMEIKQTFSKVTKIKNNINYSNIIVNSIYNKDLKHISYK